MVVTNIKQRMIWNQIIYCIEKFVSENQILSWKIWHMFTTISSIGAILIFSNDKSNRFTDLILQIDIIHKSIDCKDKSNTII